MQGTPTVDWWDGGQALIYMEKRFSVQHRRLFGVHVAKTAVSARHAWVSYVCFSLLGWKVFNDVLGLFVLGLGVTSARRLISLENPRSASERVEA